MAFRIVVVHPVCEYLHACEQALRPIGIEVLTAQNDEEGLALARKSAPHLILTETMTQAMPVEDLAEMVKIMLASQSAPHELQMKTMLDDAQQIAHLGSWTVNLETKRIRWSDGLYALAGLAPGEIEPSYELALSQVHPEYQALYSDAIQQCIRTLQPAMVEVLGVRKNGEEFWAAARVRVTVDAAGKPIRMDGVVQDISERKANEIRLKEEINFSSSLLENLPGIFVLFDVNGVIHRWNQYALDATHYAVEDTVKGNIYDLFLDEEKSSVAEEIRRVFLNESREIRTTILTKDGKRIPYHFNVVRYSAQEGPMAIAIGFNRSLQAQTEQALQRQLTELIILQKIAAISLETNDEDELVSRSTLLLSQNIYTDHFGLVLRNEADGKYSIHTSYTGLRADGVNLEFEARTGIIGHCIAERKQLRIDDVTLNPDYIRGTQTDMRSELCVPMIVGEEVIGVMNAESKEISAFSAEDERLLSTAATLLGVAIQKIRLYKKERQRWMEAAVQHEVSRALTMSLELDDVLDNLLIGLQKVISYDSSAVFFVEGDHLRIVWGRGFPVDSEIVGLMSSVEDRLFQEIQKTRQALIVEDVQSDARFVDYGDLGYIRGWMGVPLIDQGEVFGYFTLDKMEAGFFNPEKAALASTFANHAASAIMKARLFTQTRQRLSQLQALHEIDQMITTSFDLQLTLKHFLRQVCNQLCVDAADVLQYNKVTHELDFVASRGFRTNALQHTHLPLTQGYAGKAALEQMVVHVPDLNDDSNEFSRSYTFSDENFHAYFGIPLIAKGELKGVLEVFHRSPLGVDDDWREFLHILSTQAAIAIENLDLFENLQTTNLELTLAYDATLEGWAKTLEMRDQETEGHSVRVTDLAVQLARAMGISADAMVHIRRGAMLHDIGKMGIPDSILQKPAALNAEEWEIMKTHPVLAYNSLSQIPFLKPAMEIPYLHHEKWDGSGYPHGLAGDAIPLSARIFAIVDVYDALSSERPYRPPWEHGRVVNYIREESGRHFDPRIVDAFMALLAQNPELKNFM